MPFFPIFASEDESVGSSLANSQIIGQEGNGENSDEFRLNMEGQHEEHRKTLPMETSSDQLADNQNDLKKILERISELEKQNENMAKAIDEQLTKLQKEINEKIAKWEKQKQQKKEQKEKKKKEKALSKSPMNFWDPSACHKYIGIIGMAVRHKGKDGAWRNVFAKHSITHKKSSDGIFYFEISIKQKKHCYLVSFGVAFKRTDKSGDKTIRSCVGSYAWDSDGKFWINECGKGSNGKYSYGVGDVVGIGINLANRRMITTKNGRRLDSSDLYVYPSPALVNLFPFVSLGSFAEIEANFGPNFAFDLATL